MFDFGSLYQAKGVPDAITALMADQDAVLICGGSDVLLRIREGRLAGHNLVSIRGLPELCGVLLENNETIQIRPATPFADICESAVIQGHLPALYGAIQQLGGPQLRNVATIGGNLCNGACSADTPPVLLTLNAELEITGAQGARRLPLEDFFEGPGRVNLTHGELLTAIRIAKANYEGYHGHYIKQAQRQAMDIATLGCAVHVKLSASQDVIEDVRLAYAVAAPVPLRCHAAEEAVKGQPPGEELYHLFGQTALGEVSPRTSWRASEAFRRQLVQELAGRALKAAIHKAKGEVKP